MDTRREPIGIVMADDDPDDRELTRDALAASRLRNPLYFVSDGEELLEFLRHEGRYQKREPLPRPGLILLDLNMPNGDGMNLLAQIRAEPTLCRIPVIMLTGSLEPETKRRALEMGATDFINKPVDPGEFAARLRGVIQLKAYEDQLREQNKVLEQQVVLLQRMENLGFLASGIVHDLNNILAGIIGHAQLISVNLHDQERAQSHIHQTLEAGEQAAQLVRQILAIGRRDSGERSSQDLGRVIDRAVDLLLVSVPDEIAVSWKRPPRDVTGEFNAGQLNQIIMNLCINAVHAMTKGGTLSIRLDVVRIDPATIVPNCVCRPGAFARVTVSDTGIGMADDIKARIFEPLFTTKAAGHGTGLGLSVVRRIVEQHQGFIAVESTPGKGTKFDVYLPMTEAVTSDDLDDILNGTKASS